ncbi:MAG: TlpA family protein disulfide reductase [Brevundimonas sp.]|uniref:TlpA family protein disulfide reductase n=1 Tax=Brevundimonas sp. TaxID=1871086 RepID=UPI00391F32A4
MAVSGKFGWAVAGLGALVLVGGGALATLYATRSGPFKADDGPAAQSELARFAVGPLVRLEAPADTPIAPDHVFYDREGAEVRLADFRGKVLVVNLWAMWCAPCRTEMPTLQRLAEAYAGDDRLVVLPINVDTGADAIADAKSFIDVHAPLPMYSDPSFQLPFLFVDPGKMPQTLLIDRQGRVRAAFSGEADWAGPEARALVEALLAEEG